MIQVLQKTPFVKKCQKMLSKVSSVLESTWGECEAKKEPKLNINLTLQQDIYTIQNREYASLNLKVFARKPSNIKTNVGALCLEVGKRLSRYHRYPQMHICWKHTFPMRCISLLYWVAYVMFLFEEKNNEWLIIVSFSLAPHRTLRYAEVQLFCGFLHHWHVLLPRCQQPKHLFLCWNHPYCD